MLRSEVIMQKADYGEIPNISKTLAECWKSAYKGIVSDDYLSSLPDSHWIDYLEKNLKNSSVDCIVVKKDKKIIGASIFGSSITDDYPTDSEIISLYLLPQFIGQGIGHMLLNRAENELIEKKYKNCVICVFCENERAIRFYKFHGYEIVSECKEVTLGTQKLQYYNMRKGLSR